MIAANKVVYISETITANGATEKIISLPDGAKNLILVMKIANRTDGTFDMALEHSDDGSAFLALGTVAASSVNGTTISRVSEADHASQILKVTITASAVTLGADIEASVRYTK